MARDYFVYAIGLECGPYKVGWTSVLDRRLAELQKQADEPLYIHHTRSVSGEFEARRVEAAAHALLHEDCIAGEWFSAPLPAITKAIDAPKPDAAMPRVRRLEPADLKAIRKLTNRSAAAFARWIGLPVATIRGWESGRRQPPPYVSVLYRVIAHKPEVVESALSQR